MDRWLEGSPSVRHEVIADPTIADAVLDRLIHNAHRLVIKGDSMRKITAQTSNLDAAKKP